jgi:hypothetical protein
MMRALTLLLVLCFLIFPVSAGTFIKNFSEDSSVTRTVSDTFSNIHDGIGTSVGRTGTTQDLTIYSNATGTTFYSFSRGLYTIDLSNLSASNTVTAVKVSLYYSVKLNQLGKVNLAMTNATPANPFLHAKEDYNKTGMVISPYIGYDSISTTWNNFTLDANGIAYFQSRLGSNATVSPRLYWDIANTFNGTYANGTKWSGVSFITVNNSDVAKHPFVTIDYTPPDTTPPASITNLANVTTCQNITWQWTNPTDIDFDVVQIYQDNTFLHNVTGNTDFWDSLSESTAYTFSSHTCDTTGNCNTTWANLTSTTDTCPVPTTSPTTTATTVPPTTTTASPTPTPLPTSDCTYFNLTGVTFGLNSTDWNVTEGLNTWGVSTFNVTQGNVSWWICRATPTTTAPPTWQPLINPSTDIKTDWLGLLWQWWWLPVLIFAMILLFRRQ